MISELQKSSFKILISLLVIVGIAIGGGLLFVSDFSIWNLQCRYTDPLYKNNQCLMDRQTNTLMQVVDRFHSPKLGGCQFQLKIIDVGSQQSTYKNSYEVQGFIVKSKEALKSDTGIEAINCPMKGFEEHN